jgi:hypothetical protein
MLKYLIIAMLATPSLCANYASRCDAGSVVVVGLNPALQRTISLSTSLEVGSVNRASSVQVMALVIYGESVRYTANPEISMK